MTTLHPNAQYVPCTSVKVGMVTGYGEKIVRITTNDEKNLLGGSIPCITFHYDNGESYTASAVSWSPEDVSVMP